MSVDLVYALHGFLGQAHDWEAVQALVPSLKFKSENLFAKSPTTLLSFEVQAEKLVHKIENEFSPAQKKIFLGYSMGGRLGLYILKLKPDLFDHYIFLSTNPGWPDEALAEREARLQNDIQWSNKISEANWESFLKEWNSQAVLSGPGVELSRELAAYDLIKLKWALTEWSLAKQKYMGSVIAQYQHKITWVVGELDSKYMALAEALKKQKALSDYERASCGHRIYLDQPQFVAQILQRNY